MKWELWYLSVCYALVQWSITAVVYFNPVRTQLAAPLHVLRQRLQGFRVMFLAIKCCHCVLFTLHNTVRA